MTKKSILVFLKYHALSSIPLWVPVWSCWSSAPIVTSDLWFMPRGVHLHIDHIHLVVVVHLDDCYDIRCIFLFFFYLTKLYYYSSHMTDDFTFAFCFCLPMTHFDSLLIHCSDSVLVLLFHWLSMTPLLYIDSGWVVYCTWLTMSRLLIVSDSYCSHDSLFSNTISTDVFGP